MKNIVHVSACALLVFIGSTLAANEEGILRNGDRVIVDNDGAWVYDGTGEQFLEDRKILFDHSQFEWGDSPEKIEESEKSTNFLSFKESGCYIFARKLFWGLYFYNFNEKKLDSVAILIFLMKEESNKYAKLQENLQKKYGEPINLLNEKELIELEILLKKASRPEKGNLLRRSARTSPARENARR
jgi:hypothetical protein